MTKLQQWSQQAVVWLKTGNFEPQTFSVQICNGNVYYYDRYSLQMVSHNSIFQCKPNEILSMKKLSFDTSLRCVSMHRSNDKHIAIVSEPVVENSSFIAILDTRKNKISGKLNHPESSILSTAEWTSDNRSIFSVGIVPKYNWNPRHSQGEYKQFGFVYKWDVETQTNSASFDYEEQYKHGKLCVHQEGNIFVTSTENKILLWDCRTKRAIVKEHKGIKAHSMGFINNDQSLLTVMGGENAWSGEAVTLDFGNFTPVESYDPLFEEYNFESTSRGFLRTIFGDSLSVGYNYYGEVGLWDNETRGCPMRIDPVGMDSWGPGINCVSLSEKEDMIAISASKADSQWCNGLVGAVTTIRSFPDPEYHKNSLKREYCACSIQ